MIQSERLLNTLVNLIQIDSPSGEEDAIDDELSRRLQALGCEVLHDSYGNIVAKLPGEGDPVLVSSHMDTVDPGRGIKPSLDGDTLRADGTTILGGDCKAGLTIVLEALASIQESGVPHRPVDVVFTRHEEGGLVGVHHLDFRLVDAKMGVVFDGEGPVSRVTVAAPSQNVVKANITGRAAHAGVEPEKGLSAILIAAEIITRLPLGRIDQETTANIGRMDAGLKRNIVRRQRFWTARSAAWTTANWTASAGVPDCVPTGGGEVPRRANLPGNRKHLPGIPCRSRSPRTVYDSPGSRDPRHGGGADGQRGRV